MKISSKSFSNDDLNSGEVINSELSSDLEAFGLYPPIIKILSKRDSSLLSKEAFVNTPFAGKVVFEMEQFCRLSNLDRVESFLRSYAANFDVSNGLSGRISSVMNAWFLAKQDGNEKLTMKNLGSACNYKLFLFFDSASKSSDLNISGFEVSLFYDGCTSQQETFERSSERLRKLALRFGCEEPGYVSETSLEFSFRDKGEVSFSDLLAVITELGDVTSGVLACRGNISIVSDSPKNRAMLAGDLYTSLSSLKPAAKYKIETEVDCNADSFDLSKSLLKNKKIDIPLGVLEEDGQTFFLYKRPDGEGKFHIVYEDRKNYGSEIEALAHLDFVDGK